MIYQIQDNLTLISKTIIKPDRSFSFNSYLITGETNVLIDTVPEKASDPFWEEVRSLIPLKELDAFILNHSEEDHSGALPVLLREQPDIPVYCTESCAKRMAQSHPSAADWNLVQNRDTVRIGKDMIFTFCHTPGLHWDDNMVTLWEDESILFSNDLYGQAIGKEIPLDTQLSAAELISAAKEYYLRVFSEADRLQKQVLLELDSLPLRMIAPGHGLVVGEKINDLKRLYRELI